MAIGGIIVAMLRRAWLVLWRGKPPGLLLTTVATITASTLAVPLVYVLTLGLRAGGQRWASLLDTRIPTLLQRSLGLMGVVTALAVAIGATVAWLVVRSDLPGRKTWALLLSLPMVIPPYVGAMTYIVILGPRGWIRDWLGQTVINIYSFTGVALVLVAFTFPYVYLIAASSLRRMSRSYEEAAMAAGLGPLGVLWRVTFPMLRPAMGAGALLVALYVLSDFGAVSMLRYSTFTTAIFYQIGSFDQVSAAILSVVLVVLTLIILWLENGSRSRMRFYTTKGSGQQPATVALGKAKWLAVLFTSLLFTFSVLLPLIVLVYWSSVGITRGALDHRFWGFTLNSLSTAGIAALLAMMLSLPIVFLKYRNPGVISSGIAKLAYAGYALPGVIVALGIIFVLNNYLPSAYGTVAMVILAYVIRFIPQNMQACEAALSLVSPQVEEAAQSLGLGPWRVLLRVTLPLAFPGILAGGAFVFVSSLKELPATLLLRPAGMDTLAVRIWIEASEAFYQTAAPAALIIILLSVIPLRWMLSKY